MTRMSSVALRLTFQKQEEGRRVIKVNFVDEDGQSVMHPLELHLDVTVPDDTIFLSRNAVITLQNLTLKRAGLYSIEIMVDGSTQTNIPLLVKHFIAPATS